MLTRLEFSGFRNLHRQTVEISQRLVVVSGANAQGKTSVLEAAYMLATTRSFRTREPRDAIAHGAAQLRVSGAVSTTAETTVNLALSRGHGRGERRLAVGEYDVGLADYLEHLPALVMTGDSSRAIAGSPSERRRYMDRATASAVPAHIPDLAEYRRALAQRNRLLRDEAPDGEIEPWDEVLASVGERIARRRRAQVQTWSGLLVEWASLFPEATVARLDYVQAPERRIDSRSSDDRGDGRPVEGGDRVDILLRERLCRARETDRRQRVTTVGPHRDDLAVTAAGQDLWRYGSAGQVRSAVSAITLAQARQVRSQRPNEELLLVLDDVDTDLDESRFGALMEGACREGQILAATSKPSMAAALDGQGLLICEGRIRGAS